MPLVVRSPFFNLAFSGSRPQPSVPARRCPSLLPEAPLLDSVRPVFSRDGYRLQEFQDLLSHRSRNRRKQAYPQQGLAQEPQHKIAASLDDHLRDPTNRSQRLSWLVTDVPLPFLAVQSDKVFESRRSLSLVLTPRRDFSVTNFDDDNTMVSRGFAFQAK